MKVVYIAGPYRGKCEFDVLENIIIARWYALHVWELGGVALCPHSNTAFFGGAHGIKDEVWLNGDLELLRRCDAIYLTSRWQDSTGARQEKEFAENNGIPVLFTRKELIEFLK